MKIYAITYFCCLRWDGSAENDLVLTIFNEQQKLGQAPPTYIKPDMVAPPVSVFLKKMFSCKTLILLIFYIFLKNLIRFGLQLILYLR